MCKTEINQNAVHEEEVIGKRMLSVIQEHFHLNSTPDITGREKSTQQVCRKEKEIACFAFGNSPLMQFQGMDSNNLTFTRISREETLKA